MSQSPKLQTATLRWARIERLFHDALKLAPNARDAFLQEHAEDRTEYEGAMRLVHATELSTSFLNTHLPISDQRETLGAGAEVGGWRILDLIGVGGMGEVYRAERRNETYAQTAALKIIRIPDENVRVRFQRE